MKTKTTFFKSILLIILSANSLGVWAQPSTTDPDHACINSTEDYWVINTPGSNYNWILSGGGTIIQGQGSSAIRINWTLTIPQLLQEIFVTGMLWVVHSVDRAHNRLQGRSVV